MAVAVLRKLKEYHERERVRKNADYGGTWNGKKYGGWPREHISDWVFPRRTNPANSMANFFGKEDAAMKALAKVEDFDPLKSLPNSVGRELRGRSQPAVECSFFGTVNSTPATGSTRASRHADTCGANCSDGAMPPWRSAAAGECCLRANHGSEARVAGRRTAPLSERIGASRSNRRPGRCTLFQRRTVMAFRVVQNSVGTPSVARGEIRSALRPAHEPSTDRPRGRRKASGSTKMGSTAPKHTWSTTKRRTLKTSQSRSKRRLG
jgi:hypothetical protein